MKNLLIITLFLAGCTMENKDPLVSLNQQTIESRSSLCPTYFDLEGCEAITTGFVQGGDLIYQGCSLPYQVNGYACDWGIYFDPPIIDWSALYSALWDPQSECTSLMNEIMTLYLQDETDALNDLYLDIKKQVSLFAQNRVIEFNSQVNDNFYLCEGGGPSSFSVVTQETKCSMFCTKVVPGTGVFVTEIQCGSGCCTRTTPFCVIGPKMIEYGTPVYEGSVPCIIDDNSIFSIDQETCPTDSTPLEICNSACSKI